MESGSGLLAYLRVQAALKFFHNLIIIIIIIII